MTTSIPSQPSPAREESTNRLNPSTEGSAPPLVSIVSALYNRVDLTREFIDSLVATMPAGIPYEVILVDDLSTDGTREYLTTLKAPRFRVVLNKNKGSYAANNNTGARMARGSYLALLNNDLKLTPGWLEPMLQLHKTQPEAGGIGNIQINPRTGLLDHAGVAFAPDGETFHRYKHRKASPRGAFGEVNALSSACMLIRREIFLGQGGFDEDYVNGSEDIDLCIRLRLAGYRLYVSHESKIFHHVSSSPGRFQHDDKNRIRLRQKWEPVMLEWSRQEWAGAYLRRYARHFWKMRPGYALLALSRAAKQCLKRPI